MCAEILFENNALKIENFLFSREDATDGNPYNCIFDVYVKSAPFCGTASFEYDIKEFKRFIAELEKMFLFESERAELNDIGYGSQVVFTMDKLGHMKIQGRIYGEARMQMLQFLFVADQTVLGGFIKDLKRLIE